MTTANQTAANHTPPPIEPTAAPTPEQVDMAIESVEYAATILKAAKDRHDELKQSLVDLTEKFGHPVPRAEKSKRLEGRHNTATISYGTTVEVDTEQVLRFQAFLISKKLGQYFARFFVEVTRYQLVEGAKDVLKTISLPRRVEESIASLFGRCIVVKDKTPSLKIATVKPEKPARAPRAKKGGA